MGLYYRSSYGQSGEEVNTDSFYIKCGDKKWLRGQTLTDEDLTTDVIIGDNYYNGYHAFWSLPNFNQNVYIGNNVVDYQHMFYNCTNFNSDVYINTGNTNIMTSMMFANIAGVKLHFSPNLNSRFNMAGVFFGTTISWTDMSDGNGFYNSEYNIYCYNNYTV